MRPITRVGRFAVGRLGLVVSDVGHPQDRHRWIPRQRPVSIPGRQLSDAAEGHRSPVLADVGTVPYHEAIIEIPEDVLKFYARAYQDQETEH